MAKAKYEYVSEVLHAESVCKKCGSFGIFWSKWCEGKDVKKISFHYRTRCPHCHHWHWEKRDSLGFSLTKNLSWNQSKSLQKATAQSSFLLDL